MAGELIRWCDEVKHLGITIDKKLTWKNHSYKKIRETERKFQSLQPLLGKQSKLNLKNKTRIYKTILRPTLTYAPAPWCFAANYQLERVESTQSKILRRSPLVPENCGPKKRPQHTEY